jgi:hypothetical protein
LEELMAERVVTEKLAILLLWNAEREEASFDIDA